MQEIMYPIIKQDISSDHQDCIRTDAFLTKFSWCSAHLIRALLDRLLPSILAAIFSRKHSPAALALGCTLQCVCLRPMTECGTRIGVTDDGEERAATGRGRTLVPERGAVRGAWNEDGEGVLNLNLDATQATPLGVFKSQARGSGRGFVDRV
jgi:hypothetical protein